MEPDVPVNVERDVVLIFDTTLRDGEQSPGAVQPGDQQKAKDDVEGDQQRGKNGIGVCWPYLIHLMKSKRLR